jgi:hypothetical protein
MITTPGVARPPQQFRELAPGDTLQVKWQGKQGDYLVTDLIRAAADSSQPWDYRAAIHLTTGVAVWLPATETVMPTEMEAGPAA